MSVEEKLAIIKEKFDVLSKDENRKKVFGATDHRYKLNPVLKAKDIKAFEKKYKIKLPEDYRCFLMKFGNGGAGPFYGIEELSHSIYEYLDHKSSQYVLDPSKPFEISEPWNMEYTGSREDEEAFEKWAEEYNDAKWANGLLRLCNYGCGQTINLVVNGPEYGNMWVDDRGNDGGIYPDSNFGQTGRTSFLDWYILWLDDSLNSIKK